jgi:hypothetical protein
MYQYEEDGRLRLIRCSLRSLTPAETRLICFLRSSLKEMLKVETLSVLLKRGATLKNIAIIVDGFSFFLSHLLCANGND